ncbi:MAG: hypothetical protein FWF56_04225 [Firmicutes bacterium]|nr:hypothetical protein [Bacillota bacterium]MCL1953562.1 hypothetical protein [Bacillota bacterium]
MINLKIITTKIIAISSIIATLSLIVIGCIKPIKEQVVVKDFYGEYEFVLPFDHEKFVRGDGRQYLSDLSLSQQVSDLKGRGYTIKDTSSKKYVIEIVQNDISRYFSIEYVDIGDQPYFLLDNLSTNITLKDNQDQVVTINCLFPQHLVSAYPPSIDDNISLAKGDFFEFKSFYENTKRDEYGFDLLTETISFDTTAKNDIKTENVRVDIQLQHKTLGTGEATVVEMFLSVL